MLRPLAGQHTGADGLVDGSVGPFYVAVNRATFVLMAALFAVIAPLALLFVRDASPVTRVVVGSGIALESGALAHVALERILGASKAMAWAAHAAIAVALTAVAYAVLFAW